MIDGNQSEAALRKKIAAAEAALEGATFGAKFRRKLLPELIELGEHLQQQGRHEEAEACYARGLAHCDELLRHRQLDASTFELHVELLGRTASAMLSQGRSKDAIPTYQRAIALIESLGKDAGKDIGIAEVLGACHGQLAIALDDSGEQDSSFGHYRLSLACAESIHAGDQSAAKGISILALANNAIGHHYAETGQLQDALAHHRRSLELNSELVRIQPKDDYAKYCLATDHENLCDALLRQDQRQLAREHAVKALTLRKQIATSPNTRDDWSLQLVDSYRDLAELCTEAADHDAALQHYREALEVCRRLSQAMPEDPERSFRVADALLALGSTQEARNQPEQALDLYQLALEIDLELSARLPQEARWPANAAHCHLCSALLLLSLDRSEESVQHAHTGIQILEREIATHADDIHLSIDLARFHSDYAGGLAAHGDHSEALEQYRLCICIDRKLVSASPEDQSALTNLAITLDHIASIHERLGDFLAALDFNQQTVRVEQQLAGCDQESTEYQGRLVQAWLNVATTKRELKQLAEAQETLKRAEKIASRLLRLTPRDENAIALVAQVHRELGKVLRESGEHGSAEQEFSESVERFSSLVKSSDHPESWLANHAQSLEALAELQMDLGQASNALQPLALALANWQRIARRYPSEANVHRDLARSHELTAEAHEAIADLGSAMEHRRAAERLYERFGEESS